MTDEPADDAGRGDKPRIRVGSRPQTIRSLATAIDGRVLPDTYVTGGQLVYLERVSGVSLVATAGDEDSPLPVASTPVTPAVLGRLLAEHTYTFTLKQRDKDEAPQQEETLPPREVLGAALARTEWAVPPLLGMVGAPVLTPSGRLLQTPGYDAETGLYLAPKVPLHEVPAKPTMRQVAFAKVKILDQFLIDFPWVSEADRANYLALLVTPVLRPFTRCLTPFGIVDATMPGSGKTILTAGIGMLYGQRVLTWTHDDAELRKAITSVMPEKVGVIVFDNIGEGERIDSPVLARLITERTWADRPLGASRIVTYPNDRLWLATGNNMRIGGDMATRAVLVRLDPGIPHPEARTKFAIPHLDQWILNPANQREILWHLLVLVADWVKAGSPKARGLTMRQFTTWAEYIGGFLEHHGVKDFLTNADQLREVDDEDAIWAAFLAKWYVMHGDRRFTTRELRRDAEPEQLAAGARYEDDKWAGLFITDARGRLPTEVSLGKRLAGHKGRFHGGYRLRAVHDPRDHIWLWWVEKYQSEDRS